MEVKATLRNLRIAPRKVRRVADLVRGKSVAAARLQLKFNGMRAAKPLMKLIDSGVANAEHNHGIDTQTLRIKSLMVDQGPMYKRYMARAFGRGAELQKRCSHIRLVLEGQASGSRPSASTPKSAAKKTGVAKGENPADQEAQAPAKKTTRGTRASASKKAQPVDARKQAQDRNSSRKGSK